MRISQYQTATPLEVTLTHNDVALDLTNAATVRVVGILRSTLVIDDAAPILDRVAGKVTHALTAPQVADYGRMWITYIVVWTDGTVLPFPRMTFIDIIEAGYDPAELSA